MTTDGRFDAMLTGCAKGLATLTKPQSRNATGHRQMPFQSQRRDLLTLFDLF